MPWSKPIPFRKTATAQTVSTYLNLSLGGVQKVRFLNLWANQSGTPAEIRIEYAYLSGSTTVWMPIVHTVGEYGIFNGEPYLEVWTDEIRVYFGADNQVENAYYFGGSYRVKQ